MMKNAISLLQIKTVQVYIKDLYKKSKNIAGYNLINCS